MFFILILMALFFLTEVSAGQDEVSECLKKCIEPLARLDRSFSYIFNHYEEVCDRLESGAYCARKCNHEDQQKFHQYTTFYRVHCVDYEEDLERHLPCLRKVAKDVDDVCRDRCHNNYKIQKTDAKEKQQKTGCLSLECSTVCYFQEFIAECPESEEALLKLNIGQIHSISLTFHPTTYEQMVQECRNVHDTDYMKKKLLGMND
ncbi:CPG4 domain-containing protein [Trichostrongylus colubriformis]|uniref:CPG4 domain-containing protein n=1 Tax=Trichostrongylus colubriformis TaxID=6319 RepID=A0AAN8IKG5_TRICO